MVYITGDTHNNQDMHNVAHPEMELFCMEQGCNYKEITYLIVLGDFGLPWFDCEVDENGIHPRDRSDRYLLKWYNEKPFCVLAVMGNHDNYNMLEKLPEVEMFGNKVLKISDNVFYLKRGQFYEIEGKSFLVLGGAQSHDKEYRKENIDWWHQEEWSANEIKHFYTRMEKHGNNVDYILSHTGPVEGILTMDIDYGVKKLKEELLIDSNVQINTKVDSIMNYKKWFFGHWHSDWGYENRDSSKYIPLYRAGVII